MSRLKSQRPDSPHEYAQRFPPPPELSRRLLGIVRSGSLGFTEAPSVTRYLLALLTYAHHDTCCAYPSQAEIAELFDSTPQNIINAVKALRNRGVIKVHKPDDPESLPVFTKHAIATHQDPAEMIREIKRRGVLFVEITLPPGVTVRIDPVAERRAYRTTGGVPVTMAWFKYSPRIFTGPDFIPSSRIKADSTPIVRKKLTYETKRRLRAEQIAARRRTLSTPPSSDTRTRQETEARSSPPHSAEF